MYSVQPFEGWTIRQGVLHAPGPYPTFEIQFPQDDYHLASMYSERKVGALINCGCIGWTLGARVPAEQLDQLRQTVLLRGLKDETEWVEKLVKWDMCKDPNFKYVPKKHIISLYIVGVTTIGPSRF